MTLEAPKVDIKIVTEDESSDGRIFERCEIEYEDLFEGPGANQFYRNNNDLLDRIDIPYGEYIQPTLLKKEEGSFLVD